MKKMFLIISVIFPNSLKIFLYKHLLKWKIGKNVKIGLSIIDAQNVVLEDNVRIGHFNIFKGLKNIVFKNNSYMLNLNYVGSALYDESGWNREINVGEQTGIMSRHFFDASGGIYISDNVVIAGRSSEFWTHQKANGEFGLIPKSVTIGSNSYIAAHVLFAPGVSIPNSTIVGLGSVINKVYNEEKLLLVGNPALIKRR
ncbi:hypothetical protein [Paraliobacillus sediminis]|uniref:hypothetical protein n=1 Tax=Paraliobacillus sediminis TaxID=1885916 RepID=UPI000E3BD275|nr:hypothetical protein [Paraliobacillus sediminis]